VFRRDEVDLWLLDPGQIRALAPLASGILDPEETSPWKRQGPRDLRAQWAGRQVALRLLLGAYLEASPASLRLGRDGRGKPFLLDAQGLHFSVSSSHGWWLAAVGGQALGIDLEWVRPCPELASVARSYFSDAELARVAAAAGPMERLRTFYQIWTALEARLKLSGVGLAGLAELRQGGHGSAAWVEELSLAPDLAASLALDRAPSWVRRMRWDPESAAVMPSPVESGEKSFTLSRSLQGVTHVH
jgi:4'-phosphopantetheinyl transferase